MFWDPYKTYIHCVGSTGLLNVTADGTSGIVSRPFDESSCLHVPDIRYWVWRNILKQLYQNISVLIPKQFRIETVEYLIGALEKMRKKLLCFFMSVRPSVLPHGTTRLPLDAFSWNLIVHNFFRKSVEEIQVSLKSDNKNGYFTWRPEYIYDNISLNSS